jgi:hypothetical protein
MRQLALLMILPLLVLPACAKRVTVAQLQQALMAARAAHKSDAEMARQINEMGLSERLTETALTRLIAQMELGAKATLALNLSADQSAFLDPPRSELLPTAAPDDAAQRQMLEAARNYVAQTLTRLPNFLATRTTNRYDDTPQPIRKDEWPVRAGLHLVDSSSREVSIREEEDMLASFNGSAAGQAQGGMVSGGEFGTILGMILADTVNGKMVWSHWEQTAAGAVGVFHYSVPKSASHYEVMGLQKQPPSLAPVAGPGGGSRGTSGIAAAQNGANSSNPSILRAQPAYHGTLWLQPATGAILRVTVEADGKDRSPFRRANMLVQYGPVQIGGSQFICPLRSVALSEAFTDAQGLAGDEPTQWLNETFFTSYHRFASTVRLLNNTAPP